MKKLLKTVACLSLGLFSLTTVSAKEVDLAEGTVLEKNNVYIVGNWVFQLNSYGINGKDIAHAASRYAKLTGKDAPVYYVLEGQVFEYDTRGAAATPKELGKLDEVFDEDTINALGLNNVEYQDLVLEEVDPILKADAEKLNEQASEKGLYSVVYDEGTLTFNIKEPDKKLADFAETDIVTMFKDFVSGNVGFQKITYSLNGQEKTITKENISSDQDTDIIKLAAEVLADLAGVETTEAPNLTYAEVANKSTTATVTYQNGNETYTVTYTLEFKYDFKAEKDKVLADAAKTLKDEITQNEPQKNYGFSDITYNTNNQTLTFEIFDPSANLATFAQTKIVELFKKNYVGAVSVTYTAGSKTETKDLKNLDDANIKALAKEVLTALGGEGTDLSLGSVANKTATAKVTYADGTVVTYTLKFNFDAEKVKDEVLTQYAEQLNSEIIKLGFKSVTYNPDTNTIDFEISDPTKEFKSDTDLVSKIAGMFDVWSTGATQVIYTVNGGTDKTTVDFTKKETSTTQLAMELLAKMAGIDYQSHITELANLTVGQVAGSTAKADFYFVGQTNPNTYTVNFNYDIEKSTYETLKGDATGLKNIDATDGYFSDIVFENGKATFTFKSDKAESTFASYSKKPQVIEMFDDAVEGATSITWTVGTETKTYPSQDEELPFSGTLLAKDLLTAMAKQKNGQSDVTNPANIKLKDVEGVEATATITYKVGRLEKTVNLKLVFVQAAGE